MIRSAGSASSCRPALCIALAAVLVAVGTADAQVYVRGRVLEFESGEPIPGARVALLAASGREVEVRLSGTGGTFEFETPPLRAVQFRVQRIGYHETLTPILRLDGHDTYQVEVRMDPDAVPLAPLEVVARARTRESPVLADLSHRLANGLGWYVTREEIDRRNPGRVTDLLAMAPGVRLASGGHGLRRVVLGTRRRCPAQIYVDGMLMNSGSPAVGPPSPDDYVSPESVEAIEVYRGLATVPASFLNPEAECGVVAIWTRRGG